MRSQSLSFVALRLQRMNDRGCPLAPSALEIMGLQRHHGPFAQERRSRDQANAPRRCWRRRGVRVPLSMMRRARVESASSK